jgi:hypothetical protein
MQYSYSTLWEDNGFLPPLCPLFSFKHPPLCGCRARDFDVEEDDRFVVGDWSFATFNSA